MLTSNSEFHLPYSLGLFLLSISPCEIPDRGLSTTIGLFYMSLPNDHFCQMVFEFMSKLILFHIQH